MNKKPFAVAFASAAFWQVAFPTFNGFWSEPVQISIAESRIIGAILFVGAAILWFMPSDKAED